MLQTIHEIISAEIKNFTDNPIEIVPGYIFNQYQAIKRNHLYYNSKFEDSSEYNGREKIFDNISSFRCEIASTLLDFDTKDSRLMPLNPESEIGTFLLEKELEYELKRGNYDALYDDIADELPIYGSVVIKDDVEMPIMIDLRRLFNDPSVARIRESRFIILKHYLTASQLRAKKGIWDDKVIDKMLKDPSYLDLYDDSYQDVQYKDVETRSPYYVVYERYGEVAENVVKENGDPNKYIRSLFITSAPEAGENVVLFKSEWKKEWPFLDAHYAKTRGRWLGVGVIESIWSDQERKNELANQKRIAMEISGMLLMQTSDQTTLRNILKDRQSGDVIRKSQGGEGLLPVDNRIKNLIEFQDEESKWDSHADRMTFANDIVRGGEIAASTPATNAVIQNNNSTSVFLKKRERVAQMLRTMFNEFVFPKLKKNLNKEHIMHFTGSLEDIEKFDSFLLDGLVRKEKVERILNGEIVDENVDAMIRDNIQNQLRGLGTQRFLTIKDKMYEGLEFQYDIIIDGQQKNLQTSLNNVFSIIQTIGSNPALLDDPRVKTLVYEYMAIAGVSPLKLQLADLKRQEQVSMQQQQMPQGGGLDALSEMQSRVGELQTGQLPNQVPAQV